MVHKPSTRRHPMAFGAIYGTETSRFQIWAPDCAGLHLHLEDRDLPMIKGARGFHHLDVAGLPAGTRYRYRLPNGRLIADPASRFQPEGLEGPSELIDPASYHWQDSGWHGRAWHEAVIYEIHIGAFTSAGNWTAAAARLPDLADLGITAVQIMPVAQSYGRFNWGYDGVLWYAPHAAFGRPEAMKAFVNKAHHLGIMVFLDVVYNHFGAVGNDLPNLGPMLSPRHSGPWGDGINLDGEGAQEPRAFIVENALYWLEEYHLDGLRFDAVHEMQDDSPTHILQLVTAEARAAHPERQLHLICENSDNDPRLLTRGRQGRPRHFTAQWNDDLHHALHARVTGETTGYYADFAPAALPLTGFDTLTRALAEGYAFQGEMKPHEGARRGNASGHLPPLAFVSYMQNHDQIGNRVHGNRIHHYTPWARVQAFATIVLLSPQIPLIFMGDEIRAETSFPFFADAPPDLQPKLHQGRKSELKSTPEHEDPHSPDVEDTPHPSKSLTFAQAKLDWHRPLGPDAVAARAFYRDLLAIRQRHLVPRLEGIRGQSAAADLQPNGAIHARWRLGDGSLWQMRINLQDKPASVAPLHGQLLWRGGQSTDDQLGLWSVDVWLTDASS